MPRILTAASRMPGGMAAFVARFWDTAQHGPFRLELLDTPTASEPVVEARVNHGRWIGDCPTEHCNNAMYVDPDDPRFYCTQCLNPLVQGTWLPVVFPAERDQIEAALVERPAAATRNWEPGEPVDELAAETARRG